MVTALNMPDQQQRVLMIKLGNLEALGGTGSGSSRITVKVDITIKVETQIGISDE
jgi:hypothetical protein